MKKKIILVLLSSSILAIAIAQERIQTKTAKTQSAWETVHAGKRTKITVKGNVEIGADDKHISSLSTDGSIIYLNGNQRLEITADKDGVLNYRVNKVMRAALDANDQKLVQKCIRSMIDHGVDAQARVQRILAASGKQGVLQEIDALDGDYVRSLYLSALLNTELSETEMTSILQKSNKYLSSDYYKAKLLADVQASFLAHPSTSEAYLQNVESISSDYYRSTTLERLMKSTLSSAQAAQILALVQGMGSDYYQAKLYKQLVEQEIFGSTGFNDALKLIFTMDSDYYKAELVKSLTERDLQDTDWATLIGYSSQIGSEYYQSQMLMRIADKMPNNEELKKNLIEAAKMIKSELYYGKLMRKLMAT